MSTENKESKVVFIGLDGATFDIIDPLIEGGKLPHIKRLIDRGSRGVLRSVVPPYSPPAWISMLTGKNPGKHGVFHFLKRKKRSYDLEMTSFSDVKESTIFSLLSHRGIGCGVMNIPMTYPPPENVSGFFVSGIPVPPRSRSYVVPNDLLENLEAAGYRVDYDFRGFEPNREEEIERWADYEALEKGLFEIARKRVDIFLDLVEIEDLPLLFFVISLTDRVQHYFWRFADEQHPGFSEEGHRRFGDVIQRAYMLADDLVGKIVEKCGDDVNYFLVSDHGAGPHYGDFYLNGWLVGNGFLQAKKVPRLVMKHAPLKHVLSRLGVGFLTGIFPESVRSMAVPYPGKKRLPDVADIIWSETKAFASMYGIRVNLEGREPEGIVGEGGEYQVLIDQIKEALGRLTNPLDGSRLLTECVSKEEAFSGPYLDGSPDLFMNLSGISVLPTESWVSDVTFQPRKTCPSSGTHRIEGIFIGSGPSFISGNDVGEIKIEDIMPTTLYLFEVPIPGDVDGKVILDAMVDKRPVKIQDELSAGDTGKSGKGYSKEEEDQITENLRGMGYI